MQHGPAPRHGGAAGGVGIEEHADRDDLHAVRDGRQDHVADARGLRGAAVGVDQAEDPRDREAVHVGVDEADREALRRERDREVRGERGLADAALAARDRVDAREAVGAERDAALGGGTAEPFGERATPLGAHHADRELEPRDPGHGLDGLAHVALDGGRGRAADDRQRDVHVGHAVRLDAHVGDHVELGDGAADLGIHHAGERAPHGVRRQRPGAAGLSGHASCGSCRRRRPPRDRRGGRAPRAAGAARRG